MHVRGKFLYEGNEKFYVRGVTYGTFRPNEDGSQFPSPEVVESDFRLMAEKGFNSVRTYTVPPLYLLDLASKYGLKVMVGLPWEQHITFLDEPGRKNDILKRVKESVSLMKGHPAILCYTIGNEIPATIVRWYGKKRTEDFLRSLYKKVKSVDPLTLVTYVNYPTTEYLDVSFLDFDCFNVYLETPEKLGRYISRLHNLSGDRPLVLAEIGLDSMRNGEARQAEVLNWQISTIFEKGCAGMFVFAWTDEWWRGGFEIEDWDFGIVNRQRKAKPALHTVSSAMKAIPVRENKDLPFISVVVCSYNGSATIRECLTEILKLDYPNFEVIVVNDGSKDNLAGIVSEFPVKLISTPNRGLSNARNTGMYNSAGEIVAYIDDDAFPDRHWLRYLAYAYQNSDHACIGGPNIAPSDDGFIATCVANAPGGPVHVLLSDEIAEHVPGCNMTFRKDALMKIGGFDPVYRNAGDDVDVCWRIQDSGRTIGFHPSALVWHRRRNSFKAYWRQQKGYGKAEALLEYKWPEKYNAFGHVSWAGRIYGNGFTLPVKVKKDRIFHGTWGTALFQSVYAPAQGFWNSLPLMPEWYLFSLFLAILGGLGFLWAPLLWAWALFAASLMVVIAQAIRSASKNVSLSPVQKKNPRYRIFIAWLHLIQPVARLYGRFMHGLTPWRKRGAKVRPGFLLPIGSKTFTHWSETWKASETWLTKIEDQLKSIKARVRRGGQFDDWDLQLKSGLLVRSKGLLAIEEHGGGKQFLKFRCKAGLSLFFLASISLFLAGGTLGLIFENHLVAIISGALFLIYLFAAMVAHARCISSFSFAFERLDNEQEENFRILKKEKSPASIQESIQVVEQRKSAKGLRTAERGTTLQISDDKAS
jgi:glycosyltransferase involved in cell wall biosynthesis